MLEFNIIVNTASAGVSAAGFGRIAVLSTEEEIGYQVLKDLKDFKGDKDSKTYKVLQAVYSQTPKPAEVIVLGRVETTAEEVLADLLEITDDFFFIVTNEPTDALAKEVETLEKMLFLTVNSVSEVGKFEGLENTVVFFHEDEDQFPGEALTVVMSQNVGGKTAHFKHLNGVKPSRAERAKLQEVLEGHGNIYITKKGYAQVSGGTTASGQWIDILLGAYWTKFTMDSAVMHLAVNQDKIGYNNRGVGMLAGTAGTVMAEAINKNIIDDFVIEYKDTREISSAEKATRVYNYLTARGQLQGAIHGGDIVINLQYEEVGR